MKRSKMSKDKIDEIVKTNTLQDYKDEELTTELRSRGYELKCTKPVTVIKEI